MASNKVKGGDLMVFINMGTSEAPDYRSIAYATSHTLELTAEFGENSTKDSKFGEWSTGEIESFSWTVTSENLVADQSYDRGATYSDLYKLMVNREEVDLIFGMDADAYNGDADVDFVYHVGAKGWTNNDENYIKGKAYITSLSLNAPSGIENATLSVNFQGNGRLHVEGKGVTGKKKQ